MKKNSLGNRLLIALSFLFLYAPIFVLIAFSFNASKSRTVWTGFSLQWYAELLHDTRIIKALSTTLQVSLIAAAVATVAGTAAAVGFFSMRRRTRGALLTVNNIPLTNADIITGVSLMLLFVFFGGVFGFERGMGTLLIAHITFDVPYVILSVMPKLRQLDRNLIEAAQDLGATPWQGFWKVVMPELRSGILSGALMAFTMSVDDFVISYFTAGTRVSTLAMEIYAMTRKRISPEINALSTLVFGSVLTLLIVINVRSIRQERAEERRLHALRRDAAVSA